MTIYDQKTGEVLTLDAQPSDLATQTDSELVAMSEQALDFTVALLNNGLSLQELPQLRGKQQALSALLATNIRSREARLEAANNLTEARLRVERHTGRILPQIVQRGGNQKSKSHDVTLILSLDDYQITKNQSAIWQKEAAHPEEVFEDYVATGKENGWELSSTGFLRWAKTGEDQLINQSLSNEWYTPLEYIEAARFVMGGIDLDPASCEYANQTVQATQIFTLEDSGLDHEWPGRVWLNPPYGRDDDNTPNQRVWSERLIMEHGMGNVSQAVMLVNAVTDRAWFQPLWNYPICFAEKRIKFYSQDDEIGQPTHGNVLVYFGENVTAFYEHFAPFGSIVMPAHLYAEVAACLNSLIAV